MALGAAGPAGAEETRTGQFLTLDPSRIAAAKPAYTTRFVARLLATEPAGYVLRCGEGVIPRPGDVVLARVENIGQHKAIERPDGRRATLFRGDEVIVAYGHRYAPDQFEAEVPGDLGPVHLVAAGGVAGRVLSAHGAMAAATLLRPVGLLADARGVMRLKRCAPFRVARHVETSAVRPPGKSERPMVVAVLGTSMNAGKTTTAAAIVRGLTRGGRRVAAGKVTGTGAGGDSWLYKDSGAARVLDFTDFGHVSTYRLPPEEVQALFLAISGELNRTGPDAIVLEIADGPFQPETARLIEDPSFLAGVDHVVYAASDAMGALGGLSWLSARGVEVTAVSGILTRSPLAVREASAALDVPVLSIDELAAPGVADTFPAARGGRADDALAS
jgi:hypothetical protein